MTLPNFLVIGVAKGGTTSLHHYLRQHPDIYVYPDKAANFFWTEAAEHGRKTVKTLTEYERLFADGAGRKAIGEIANQYMNSSDAAERIRRDLPAVRLLVSLRNPVDRAWSDYLGRVRILRESGSFEDAVRPGRPCLEWGFYYPRLKRFYDRFPREQIHVMLYDELNADRQRALREVLAFLGVDQNVPIDTTMRHNAAAVPRSRLLNRVVFSLVIGAQRLVPRRWHGTGILARFLWMTYRSAPTLSEEMRARLCDRYRDDILATSELIGRDLSHWI